MKSEWLKMKQYDDALHTKPMSIRIRSVKLPEPERRQRRKAILKVLIHTARG